MYSLVGGSEIWSPNSVKEIPEGGVSPGFEPATDRKPVEVVKENQEDDDCPEKRRRRNTSQRRDS